VRRTNDSQRHINARKNQHHSAVDILRNQSEWQKRLLNGKKEQKRKMSKYVTPPSSPQVNKHEMDIRNAKESLEFDEKVKTAKETR
jgi:hypothetical protein